ncbi:RpiB/LacA/LacB family sugar-phosphate isomerase [Streptococcus caprae]|uniref:RpiB/LacA/LacB family sugar-phosphate isomerase n=1 Tax=Streptococcus caprae TaxID=1640501 RepID=A0ABV8CVI4_9STRE
MRIGVIQASTRVEINELLFSTVQKVAGETHEVYNLGVFPSELENYSYTEVAIMISLLIESGSLDFMVTGCSSGQGMMLACNSLPGLKCGLVQTPQDAFLFGRINNGNVVSFPLGLNVRWSAELNLEYTLEKLFDGEFGVGYPKQDAGRKRQEASLLDELNRITKRSFKEILPELPVELIQKIWGRQFLHEFIQKHATNYELIGLIEAIET